MNIFKREMRANLKSLIIWGMVMALLIVAGMGKYAGTESASADMIALLDSMPESLKVVFGIGNFDISTALGFYGIMYLYIIIMGAVHAGMLGAGIISKEERDKTTEFLIVKPLKREKIVTDKLLAALANIAIMNVITFAVSYYMVAMFMNNQYLFGQIAMMMFGLLMVQLIFLSVGMALAAINKNPKKAPIFATYIILLAFVLSVIVQMNSSISFLAFLTPFLYFPAAGILNEGVISIGYTALSVVITIALLAITYKKYKERDLTI